MNGEPENKGRTDLLIQEGLKEIKEAIKHLGGLELSFLAACTYVALAAASTSHTELMLGKRISLPIFQATIGLKAFFVVAPGFICIFHAHLLMSQTFLLKAIQEFLGRLSLRNQNDQAVDGGKRSEEERLRGAISQSDVLPAVPGLVGGVALPMNYSGRVQMLLWVLLLVVNSVVPLVTLLLLQSTFLPYRSWVITLIHDIVMAADCCLLAVAFQAMERNMPSTPPVVKKVRRSTFILAGGISLLLTLALAAPVERNPASVVLTTTKSLTCLDLAGKELISSAPGGEVSNQFSRRKDALLRFAQGADLVGRDLRGANLRGAILVNGDLRNANLRHANLEGADLRRSNLESANLSDATLRRADLGAARGDRNTSFERADLQDARLSGAVFAKARFGEADMQDAVLEAGVFSDADFSAARLRRAKFNGAVLRGADLTGAVADDMSAAGSDLQDAKLWLGRFAGARFPGAELGKFGVLEGSWGLILRKADLRGVSADSIRYSDLGGANVWHLNLRNVIGLLAVDLRSVRDTPWQGDQVGGDCKRSVATEESDHAAFWTCRQEQLDDLFVDVASKNGGERTGDEIGSAWEAMRQRLENEKQLRQGLEMEGQPATCLLCNAGINSTNPKGLILSFDYLEDGPAAKWQKVAESPDEVGWRIGFEVVSGACENPRRALALVREVVGCYGPGRSRSWWEGVRKGLELKEQEQRGECTAIRSHAKRFNVGKLFWLPREDKRLERACPGWAFSSG